MLSTEAVTINRYNTGRFPTLPITSQPPHATPITSVTAASRAAVQMPLAAMARNAKWYIQAQFPPKLPQQEAGRLAEPSVQIKCRQK